MTNDYNEVEMSVDDGKASTNYTVVQKNETLRNFRITSTNIGQYQYFFCTGNLKSVSNVYVCKLRILMKQGTCLG